MGSEGASDEPGRGDLPGGRPAAKRGLDRVLGLNAVLSRALGEARPPPRAGRWALLEKVGEGGMGVVFRGEDVETHEPVAIKLLERATPELTDRFRREARILEGLRHPRIVRHLGDGVGDDGTPYLVMEWLEGRDARTRLGEGPLAIEDAIRVAMNAARGLAGAHTSGVLHRDVKPSNLFLVGGSVDDVRVIDFGIARAPHADLGLTRTGQLVGTPSYMAPEQLEGAHGPASDVWGLGVTLFELVSGQLPFTGPTRDSVLVAVASTPAPRLSSRCPDTPPALDALVARMLTKSVDARLARMSDVATELSDVLADLTRAPARRGLSHSERAPRPITHPPKAEPRASALIGRGRELGLLRGLVEESIDEGLAAVALIRGAPGSGRSALLEELTRELGQSDAKLCLLTAAAETGARGAFAVLRALLTPRARAPELATLIDALDDGRRIDAAGDDAQVLMDLLRAEWLARLDRWAEEGPIVVLLDDADAADPISLRYLARAAEHLREHAFVLVATTRERPEAPLSELRNRLGSRAVVELELGPLPTKTLARVARSFAPDASDADRERIVLRAGGMPGHVAELARSLDDPSRALPATSAALLRARLARLEPEARRILRAASIVGRRAPTALLSALLGHGATPPATLLGELDHLATEGLLRVAALGPHEAAYELAGEEVRAACDELLTDDDRVFGHGIAAEWLTTHGGEAWQIAHHFVAARRPERAGPYFLRAARLALAGEDRTSLDHLVEAGLAATTDAELRGELHTLAAEGAYWAGDVTAAFATALRATEELPSGSTSWFRSASVAITAGGQLGDNHVVHALLERALAEPEAPAASRDAADARVVCVARAVTQLGATGRGSDEARRMLTRALTSGPLGPAARAWAHRASVDPRRLHFDEGIEAWVRAHEAHLEARDQRGAAQVLLYLGSYYCWSGAWARAAEVVEDAQRIARRLGATYLDTWALYVRGKLLVETETASVALDTLRIVVERAQDSPRIRAGAELHRSLAALRGREPERAERFAREALAVPGASALRGPATAALARALLARGVYDEAVSHEPLLVEIARAPIVEFDALVRLTLVELAAARGDEAAALAAHRAALDALERSAATLASPTRRQEHLRGPHLHAATLDALGGR